MIMAHPYMPQYTEKVMSYFGKTIADPVIGVKAAEGSLDWSDLGCCEGLEKVSAPEIYFSTMDTKTIEAYRARYAGSQKERAEKKDNKAAKPAEKKKNEPKEPEKAANPVEHFNKNIALKTAKILKVEKHPEADKLYIETLDDGSGQERIILSGIKKYYKPEDLVGKNVLIIANLKPRKIMGIESRGMILSAVDDNEDLLSVTTTLDGNFKPGTIVC